MYNKHRGTHILATALSAALLIIICLSDANSTSATRDAARSHADQNQLPPSSAVDCSRVDDPEWNATNRHAAFVRILCGKDQPATNEKERPPSQTVVPRDEHITSPDYGGVDKNVLPGEVSSQHVTQVESFVWGNGCTIVVNYNDTTDYQPIIGFSISGLSRSTDCGQTFTRIRPAPFAPGAAGGDHGYNWGDPIVVYNKHLGSWFAGDIVGGGSPTVSCGASGLGLWTSVDAVNWTVGACIHSNSIAFPNGDDRPSMWVDNNPDSLYYGRMYVSWNYQGNPACNGCLVVSHSDTGQAGSWTAPVVMPTDNAYRRNMQITGSPDNSPGLNRSSVFVAGLDEGTGSEPHNRQTYMFRSTDGGDTWQRFTVGGGFGGQASMEVPAGT